MSKILSHNSILFYSKMIRINYHFYTSHVARNFSVCVYKSLLAFIYLDSRKRTWVSRYCQTTPAWFTRGCRNLNVHLCRIDLMVNAVVKYNNNIHHLSYSSTKQDSSFVVSLQSYEWKNLLCSHSRDELKKI